MSEGKKQAEKSRLHPRNKNRERYDLEALLQVWPELRNYLKPNKLGEESVDFSNPEAVKNLNQALLKHYYQIGSWDFPDENLCPPIPGRADYIHYIADLLGNSNFGRIPRGEVVNCLDVGVGASCIYPIIGVTEYGWNFIGSDIDEKSIAVANEIIKANPILSDKVECRLQKNAESFFFGVIGREEKVDVTICNPPFHSSKEEAEKGTRRKVKNLSGKDAKNPVLNFAGVSNELICKGGENGFVHGMIKESKRFAKNCFWFSTLLSKQSNLKGVLKALNEIGVTEQEIIPMGTGNKSTRIVAWSFLSKREQKEWKESRWKK